MGNIVSYNKEKLSDAITNSGWKVPQLSEATKKFINGGVSKETIYRMLKGEHKPKPENIYAVLQALAKRIGHNDIDEIKKELEYSILKEEENNVRCEEINSSNSEKGILINSSFNTDNRNNINEDAFFRDVFLLHSNSDKDRYINFFVKELEKREMSYWLDEAEIKWGESLIEKLSKGLLKSRFVIVFISEDLLTRNWPKKELSIALSEEISTGELKVLPILICDPEKAFLHNPFLRDKKYLRWNSSIYLMVEELENVLGRSYSNKWVFEYPHNFRGHIWIKIMPRIENKEKIHSISMSWGRWKFTGNIEFNEDNSIILDFKKIAEEKSWPIEFKIIPSAFVSSGKGNPVIDINKGWKCVDTNGLSGALIKKSLQYFLPDTDEDTGAKIIVE